MQSLVTLTEYEHKKLVCSAKLEFYQIMDQVRLKSKKKIQFQRSVLHASIFVIGSSLYATTRPFVHFNQNYLIGISISMNRRNRVFIAIQDKSNIS